MGRELSGVQQEAKGFRTPWRPYLGHWYCLSLHVNFQTSCKCENLASNSHQAVPPLPGILRKPVLSDLGNVGLSKIRSGSGGRSEGPNGVWCSALGRLPRFTQTLRESSGLSAQSLRTTQGQSERSPGPAPAPTLPLNTSICCPRLACH